MSVPSKIDVIVPSFREMLIDKRTARAPSPNPCLLTVSQTNLQRRGNLLRDPVLDLEHVIQVAIKPIRPHMATVQAVDQLCRQPDAVAALSDGALQHVTDA